MALMDRITRAITDTWYKSPEAAVIEQDGLIEDAFVSTISDDSPSGDTYIASSIVKPTTDQYSIGGISQEKIYDHDEYVGDDYEDLSDPSFSVSSDVEMSDEISNQVPSFVRKEEKIYQPAASYKTSAFDNFNLDSAQAFRAKRQSAVIEATNTDYQSVSVNNGDRRTETVRNAMPQQQRPGMSGTSEENRIKSAVGFNTGFATAQTQSSFTSSRLSTGGRGMVAEKAAVQVLTPTKVEDVGEACAYLKEGAVVMAVLSGITDKSTRMRYLDYLCGCCKGCDADFKEVVSVESSDCVLVAAPRGIGLKTPQEKQTVVEAAPAQENNYANRATNNGAFGAEFSLNFGGNPFRN